MACGAILRGRCGPGELFNRAQTCGPKERRVVRTGLGWMKLVKPKRRELNLSLSRCQNIPRTSTFACTDKFRIKYRLVRLLVADDNTCCLFLSHLPIHFMHFSSSSFGFWRRIHFMHLTCMLEATPEKIPST